MAKDWIKKHQESESSWESGEPDQQQLGRPKVVDAKKRKPRFTLNLNDDELTTIQRAADASGESQSAFCRRAALQKAKQISES